MSKKTHPKKTHLQARQAVEAGKYEDHEHSYEKLSSDASLEMAMKIFVVAAIILAVILVLGTR